jgi:hypothetical protein
VAAIVGFNVEGLGMGAAAREAFAREALGPRSRVGADFNRFYLVGRGRVPNSDCIEVEHVRPLVFEWLLPACNLLQPQ